MAARLEYEYAATTPGVVIAPWLDNRYRPNK